MKTNPIQEITVGIQLEGIEEAKTQLDELITKLEKANSLADELASKKETI